MYYNLESSQADRANFDKLVERYAQGMIQALGEPEALQEDPQQYAEVAWDNFSLELERDVDSVEEAKGRFFGSFIQGVKDWQQAKFQDNLLTCAYKEMIKEQEGLISALNEEIEILRKEKLMPRKQRSKQHQRITRGLQSIGACWAIQDQKFCGANDPLEDQVAGRKTYHIHPNGSYPHQDDILRFTSLRGIEEYIRDSNAP